MTTNGSEYGPSERITRLTDVPVVNGKHTYVCNACGDRSQGHDRDREHMQWRRKHWAECWGVTPA